MFENESAKSFLKRMLPRFIKAAIKGILYFAIFYMLPMLFVSQMSEFAPQLFSEYGQTVTVFAAIIIFFVVATELTSGTVFQHALNIGKALILIVFFVLALKGGILSMNLDVLELARLRIVADLRVYLLMLIAIDLLGLAKSVMQAVNFLSERTEKQGPQLRPPENP